MSVVPFVLFVVLLLNRNPDAVSAAVEECRLQQPRALRVTAQRFRVQVEVPFAGHPIGQAELVPRRRSVCRRCINRRIGICRA